jgi:hypothetical protein
MNIFKFPPGFAAFPGGIGNFFMNILAFLIGTEFLLMNTVEKVVCSGQEMG